jgi:hypothetical protein
MSCGIVELFGIVSCEKVLVFVETIEVPEGI